MLLRHCKIQVCMLLLVCTSVFALRFAADERTVLLQTERSIELENRRAEKLQFYLNFENCLFVIETQLGYMLEYIRRGFPNERLLDAFALHFL